MYKLWNVYGKNDDYCFLNAAALCSTEAEVCEWIHQHFPKFEIERIVEDTFQHEEDK